MPDINVGDTAADPKSRTQRYRYLNSYVDRHGRKRTYFRRAGSPQTLLPEPGDPDFFKAYQRALRDAGVLQPALTKCPQCGASCSSKYQKCKACGTALPRIVTPLTRRVRQRLGNQHRQIGVYLLFHKGALTYIGSSKNMAGRVADHRQNGRPFDQAFYISTTEGERLPLEKLLIKSLRPQQNHAPRSAVVPSANGSTPPRPEAPDWRP